MLETIRAFEKTGGILGLVILALFLLLAVERYVIVFKSRKGIKDVLTAIKELHIELYRAGVLERRRKDIPVDHERRASRQEDYYNERRD